MTRIVSIYLFGDIGFNDFFFKGVLVVNHFGTVFVRLGGDKWGRRFLGVFCKRCQALNSFEVDSALELFTL
jgi:hypothetical protein